MEVYWNGGTPKSSILIGFPLQTIYLGYPHLWKPPYDHSHPISAISIPAKKHVLFLHQRCCQTPQVQHLVPTVLATQDQGHNIVEDGPGAPRVLQGATLVDFWCLTGDFQLLNDDNDGWFSIVITALLSYMDFDSTWFLVSFYSCWITDAFLFFAWFSTRTRSIILRWLFGLQSPFPSFGGSSLLRVAWPLTSCAKNSFQGKEWVKLVMNIQAKLKPTRAKKDTVNLGELWGKLPQAWKYHW